MVKGHIYGNVHGRSVMSSNPSRVSSTTVNIPSVRSSSNMFSSLLNQPFMISGNQVYYFDEQAGYQAPSFPPQRQIAQAPVRQTVRPAKSEEVILTDENEENAMNSCPICLESLTEVFFLILSSKYLNRIIISIHFIYFI